MLALTLPGFSKAPKVQRAVIPQQEKDTAKEEAGKTLRRAEKRRKGRAATIIAPSEDDLGSAPVTRPASASLG